MTTKAHTTYNLLRGVICVHKPAGSSFKYVLSKLKANISNELNSLDTAPPKTYLDIDRSNSELSINLRPSYADHPLCRGPRYHDQNILVDVVKPISNLASGVILVGINEEQRILKALRKLNFTRCYHLKGILGQVTVNFYTDTKVVARAKYDKVTRIKFEKILASYQSSTQRKLFEEYGFFLQSQEAYDFAVKGLYRPTKIGAPIIYSLKLVDFNPPDFTLEVQCVHETKVYLLNLIHNLGLNLKCFATCTKICCVRQGCFHTEHSLVKNQWTLNAILNNIKLCWDILEKNYPNAMDHSPTVSTSKNSKEEIGNYLEDKDNIANN